MVGLSSIPLSFLSPGGWDTAADRPHQSPTAPRPTGNSTYAGALAAIMANVVLIGYIFVAVIEDRSDDQQRQQGAGARSSEGKKDR